MLKVNIIAVGSIKEKYLSDAISEYLKRLSRFASVSIIEIEEKSVSSDLRLKKEQEGIAILKKARGYIIALDGGGVQLSSVDFSKKIEDIALSGVSEISFVIGGSNGHSEQVLKTSNMQLSFGKMTYPHQLFRVMLLEQIYRAFTITAGTPYHK
ncbi:MAG: 23S rRNA (pseudouridine(1915)-N(3))-methyltransferase RlmH [Clostridia bacterium]|nr:23S rRNA (pseudouridine(1915)-N(3))-methyltransferase RlmH [Clostridia bacterium]